MQATEMKRVGWPRVLKRETCPQCSDRAEDWAERVIKMSKAGRIEAQAEVYNGVLLGRQFRGHKEEKKREAKGGGKSTEVSLTCAKKRLVGATGLSRPPDRHL